MTNLLLLDLLVVVLLVRKKGTIFWWTNFLAPSWLSTFSNGNLKMRNYHRERWKVRQHAATKYSSFFLFLFALNAKSILRNLWSQWRCAHFLFSICFAHKLCKSYSPRCEPHCNANRIFLSQKKHFYWMLRATIAFPQVSTLLTINWQAHVR